MIYHRHDLPCRYWHIETGITQIKPPRTAGLPDCTTKTELFLIMNRSPDCRPAPPRPGDRQRPALPSRPGLPDCRYWHITSPLMNARHHQNDLPLFSSRQETAAPAITLLATRRTFLLSVHTCVHLVAENCAAKCCMTSSF